MGLLDGIKSALGLKAEADATSEADPEDLFGMSTASVTMEADLGYEPADEAALCFSEVDSTDFQDAIEEVRQILAAGEVETDGGTGPDDLIGKNGVARKRRGAAVWADDGIP